MPSDHITSWLDALGYGDVGRALISDASEIGRRPYAAELSDMLDPEGSYVLDAVFIVEDTPTICFVDAGRVADQAAIDTLRQKLWNQNLASALLVLDAQELRAYSVPKWKDAAAKYDLLKRAKAGQDGPWSASEVQSSNVQQRLEDWFDPDRRVDRDLLRQLSRAVSALTKGEQPCVATQLQAQMLLAQVLFISYLEHRKIVGGEYRQKHKLKSLEHLVREGDGNAIDQLITRLKKDFNGDFLEPSEIKWSALDGRAMTIVSKLLSRVNLSTGQQDFWNYDFSQIPVELLSGIYETFLQDEQKVDGAYYTPRVLAELTVEEAFSGIDDLSNLRIFDGACGSGILLTTAFRKCVAYREQALGVSLNINDRIDLLRKTIFGGDVNPIACRVSAFSLYLCLLERLSPPDLVRLQREHDCRLPSLIGANIFEGRSRGDFFSDKNPLSSSGSFDILISNPPWRELRGEEGKSAVQWAEAHKVKLPHKQIAASYAAKATEAVKPGGRIVLILPSSLITAPTNADFLRQFTVAVKIERMINLADFRRLLFANAEHACTVVRATNSRALNSGRLDGQFEYWTPKVDISFAFNRLTLHDYDAADISRAELVKDNAILRRRFWGSSRDDSLLGRLSQMSRLGDALKKREGWLTAKGYHFKDGAKSVPPGELTKYSYLPTDALNSRSPVVDLHKLTKLPVERGIAAHGNLEMYSGPRVLFPDGTSTEIEVRAAFTDAKFCFSSAVGGIRLPETERDVARFLACYLRSSLAKYWLILTGYSASAERARVTLKEIKTLPFIHPLEMKDRERADRVLKSLSAILNKFEKPGGAIFSEDQYDFARDDVDDLIFSYFGLTEGETILVKDLVQLVAKSLQPTSYSELHTPLQDPVDSTSISAYLERLEKSLKGWSKGRRGNEQVRTGIVDKGKFKVPLDVVRISIGDVKWAEAGPRPKDVKSLLKAISDKIDDARAIDFFSMPNSVFVWGNEVFIVKPSRMRFWSQSAALRDADEVFGLLAPQAISRSSS